MDHGSHQWLKGQQTASPPTQPPTEGSHWPVDSSINQNSVAVIFYKLCCVFFVFFLSPRPPSETQYGASFSFDAGSRRKQDGVQTFKRAKGDTSRGLFHACGVLAFLLNSFKVSGMAPSLADTHTHTKKCPSEPTRWRLQVVECSGAVNTVWDDSVEKSNTTATSKQQR